MMGLLPKLLRASAAAVGSSGVTTFCVIAVLCCINIVEAALDQQAFGGQQGDTSASEYSWYKSVPVTVFVILVVCLVAAFAIISCMDCYNSEVSSECPAAAGSSGARWGGAGGYTAAASFNPNNRVLGSGFTAEVVIPTDRENQGLPYAMIPSQVPEVHGFSGYTPVTQASYGGTDSVGGRWGEAPRGRMPGAHVNATSVPFRQEDEPPPSYSSVDRYH